MNEQVKTDKYLEDLLAEVAGFDGSLFGPVDPVADGEAVLGIATEWQKKVYALMRSYYRELKHAKVDHEFDGCEESSQTHADLAKLQYRHDALKEILWGACREHFNAWGARGVGIRKDWQVVTISTQKAPKDFKKFIGGILGIDIEEE